MMARLRKEDAAKSSPGDEIEQDRGRCRGVQRLDAAAAGDRDEVVAGGEGGGGEAGLLIAEDQGDRRGCRPYCRHRGVAESRADDPIVRAQRSDPAGSGAR